MTACGTVLGVAHCCSYSVRLSLQAVCCRKPCLPAAWAQRSSTRRISCKGRPLWRALRAHRVEIEVDGGLVAFDVGSGETILQAALDQGVELSHDCKMGVCMTCPAKLVRVWQLPT